jgi:hypothetical protein
MAKFGQARIDDARIAPRDREIPVELALAMSQQDHHDGQYRGAFPWATLPPGKFVYRRKRTYV